METSQKQHSVMPCVSKWLPQQTNKKLLKFYVKAKVNKNPEIVIKPTKLGYFHIKTILNIHIFIFRLKLI